MNGSPNKNNIADRLSSRGCGKRLLLSTCIAVLGALLLTVPAQAALNLALEAAPDPVQPGEIMYVTLTVTNPGGSASGAVTLQMPFLTDLDFLSDSLISDGGDCSGSTCDPLETINWSLGSLPPGGGITVSLPPTVRSGAGAPPDGTVLNFSAEVFEGGVSRDTANRAVTVRTERVLELTVDEAADPVAAGQDLKYVLAYANRSSMTTTDNELRCPRPSGTTFVSASAGGVLVGGEVVWDLGTLSSHEGGRREVTFRVGGGASEGTLLEVDLATLSGDGDFLPHQTRTRAITRVENATPLRLAVVAGPDPAQPGELLQVELTATNASASFLTGVTLELHYPDGLAFVSDSLVSDGGGCVGSTCDVGETLTWSLGTLPPGRGLTVTLPPSVLGSTPGGDLISLAAELSATGGSNALRSQTVLVRSERVLELAVDDRRDPAAAGETLTYTLTYGNRSSTTTTATELRLPLPAGTTFVSATDGGVLSGGAVVWSLGTLSGHEGGRRQTTVRSGAGLTEGTLIEVDAATLTGAGAFLTHAARTGEVTRVENGNPLELSVTVGPDPAQPGELLQGQITVSNRGVDFLSGVMLEMHYPDELSFVSDALITDGGGCVGSTCDPAETVSWSLGTLAPGSGVTVSLPPSVVSGANAPPAGALIPFTAEVYEDTGSNTLASHTLVVRGERVLEVAVDENRDPVAHGADLTYTLTYGNRSANTTSNAVLRFPVPAGTTFVSSTGGGTLSNGVVVWNLHTVPGHEGGRRQVTVAVDDGVAEGTLLEVDASAVTGSGTLLTHQGRAKTVTRIEDATPLRVTVNATPDPVLPGTLLNTSVTVTNQSGATLFNVVVQLRYPDELSFLDEDFVSDDGDCPGSTCDATELVTWNLGTFTAGTTRTLTLPPTVLSGANAPPLGALIPYWVHALADSATKAVHTRSILVNDDLDQGIDGEIFSDGFESGDTSAWTD